MFFNKLRENEQEREIWIGRLEKFVVKETQKYDINPSNKWLKVAYFKGTYKIRIGSVRFWYPKANRLYR